MVDPEQDGQIDRCRDSRSTYQLRPSIPVRLSMSRGSVRRRHRAQWQTNSYRRTARRPHFGHCGNQRLGERPHLLPQVLTIDLQ